VTQQIGTARLTAGPADPLPVRSRFAALLTVLTVGGALLVSAGATWQVLVHQGTQAQPDIVDSWVRARSCVEHGRCPSEGEPTSLTKELHQGALWIQIISIVLRNGRGITQLQELMLLDLLLGGLTLILLARPPFFAGRPAFAVLLYTQVAILACAFCTPEMTALFPLPVVQFWAASAVLAESGSVWAACWAALALGAGLGLDILMGVLVPFHLAAVLVFARRRWTALVGSLLFIVIPYWLDSADSFRRVLSLLTWRQLVLVGVVLGVAPSFTRIVRERMRLTEPVQRARRIIVAGATYVLCGFLVEVPLTRSLPVPHHWAPAIVPFVILSSESVMLLSAPAQLLASVACLAGVVVLGLRPNAAALGYLLFGLLCLVAGVFSLFRLIRWASTRSREFRPWGPALTAALLLVPFAAALPGMFVTCETGPSSQWTLAQADTVSRRLFAAGFRFPDIVRSLQGPSLDSILMMAAANAPETSEFPIPRGHALEHELSREPPRPGGMERALVLLHASAADVRALPDDAWTFPVDASTSAAVIEAPAFAKQDQVRLCFLGAGESGPGYCEEIQPGMPLHYFPPYLRATRTEGHRDKSGLERIHVRYTVNVVTDGLQTPHVIRAVPEWPANWEIRTVSGLEYEGQLPGMEIRLLNHRVERGTIELEGYAWRLGSTLFWPKVTPPFVEIEGGAASMLAPLRTFAAPICGDIPGKVVLAITSNGSS
jgi:hypothetical protein